MNEFFTQAGLNLILLCSNAIKVASAIPKH